MRFNLEELEQIPVDEVALRCGAGYPKDRKPGAKTFNMHCFCDVHQNGDRNPSLTIWTQKNICKCQSGGEVSGGPIKVAMQKFNGDFKSACEWLHAEFNVPFLDGEVDTSRRQTFKRQEPKPIEYLRYDPSAEVKTIDIDHFMRLYPKMTRGQKMKMVYTFIYRFSRKGDQSAKLAYYESRGIEGHPSLAKIGFLSGSDLKSLSKELQRLFPIEDLRDFNLFDGEKPRWKYFSKAGFTVVPFHDLYSDMATGVMLRRIDKAEKGMKEYQLASADVGLKLPFDAVSALRSSGPVYIAEGHVDGLSIGTDSFVALPGIHNYKDEWLGLFAGRDIVIAFDNDQPAKEAVYGALRITFRGGAVAKAKDEVQRFISTATCSILAVDEKSLFAKVIADAAGLQVVRDFVCSYSHDEGLKKRFEKAGARSVRVLEWDKKLGGDMNELLINGNLPKVIEQ